MKRGFLIPVFNALLISQLSFPAAWAAPADADQLRFSKTASQLSSTGWMKPSNLNIYMDNDKLFEEKIKAIESAQAGDSLYLMYYIHSNDESTSHLNLALIQAAQRGVKIQMMVDFLTNYSRLDMFNSMARQSGQNLRIQFFSTLTSSIHEDIQYLTTPCLSGGARCQEEKWEIVERLRKESGPQRLIGDGTVFSKLALAGLAGKNGDSAKLAVTASGALPANASSKKKLEDDEKKDLLEFLKILFHAKVMDSTVDKAKLAIATTLFADQVGPIYESLQKTFPLDTRKKETPSGKDWERFSQFLHYKLLALVRSDRSEMTTISGGRNLENSYNLGEHLRSMVSKYLFADTDMKMTLNRQKDIQAFQNSIQSFFNWSDMSVSLEEVNRLLPVGYLKDLPMIEKEITEFKKQHPKFTSVDEEYQALRELTSRIEAQMRGSAGDREQSELVAMEEKSQRYVEHRNENERNKQNTFFPVIAETLTPRDQQTAEVAYFENLPYKKSSSLDQGFNTLRSTFNLPTVEARPRTYETGSGQEGEHNKNIHALWVEWIKNEARESAKEAELALRAGRKPPVREIIINQGYVYLPSNLVVVLGDLIKGLRESKIDASHLKITFLTNSIETTDLSPMNVYARHQMKALLEFFDQKRGEPGSLGGLEYYESRIFPNGDKTSYHSKTMYSKDSFFIGSANADVRSFIEQNNGVFIRGAPETARKMQAHLHHILQNSTLTRNVTNHFRRTHGEFLREDLVIVEEIASKYKGLGSRMKKYSSDVQKLLIDKLNDVYLSTGVLLDRNEADRWLGRESATANPLNAMSNISMKAMTCLRVFQPGKRFPSRIKTREEQLSRIKQLQNKSPRELQNEFDRTHQLI